VRRGTRAALVAAACGALVGIPALARAQQGAAASGTFTAHDLNGVASGYWTADDGSDTTLTVAKGATVTFTYPSGMSYHNVVFDDTSPKPASCDGLPPHFQAPPWTGSCTFDRADTYTFHCELHPDMKGSIVVADPPPGATPTPLPGTTPTPTPTAAPTPTPQPQSTLKVTLPSRQHGRHVRGSVQVQSAHTRLEVTVSAKLTGRRAVRVGHWLKRSAPAGRVAFSIPLIAPARHALASRHKLPVTVRVALTPPGGRTLNRAAKATVRPG
jgi:plastocyanin